MVHLIGYAIEKAYQCSEEKGSLHKARVLSANKSPKEKETKDAILNEMQKQPLWVYLLQTHNAGPWYVG